jgi:hypothetical protein
MDPLSPSLQEHSIKPVSARSFFRATAVSAATTVVSRQVKSISAVFSVLSSTHAPMKRAYVYDSRNKFNTLNIKKQVDVCNLFHKPLLPHRFFS